MNSHDPEKNLSPDDPMTRKSQALFEQASTQLDVATANRLRLMRRDALADTAQRMPRRWLPIGAVATALLAVALSWWLPQRHAVAPTTSADAGIGANEQDLLPDDDADVYAWLADAPVAVNDGNQAGSP